LAGTALAGNGGGYRNKHSRSMPVTRLRRCPTRATSRDQDGADGIRSPPIRTTVCGSATRWRDAVHVEFREDVLRDHARRREPFPGGRARDAGRRCARHQERRPGRHRDRAMAWLWMGPGGRARRRRDRRRSARSALLLSGTRLRGSAAGLLRSAGLRRRRAGRRRSRGLLHAAIPVLRSAERNLSRLRRSTTSLPLSGAGAKCQRAAAGRPFFFLAPRAVEAVAKRNKNGAPGGAGGFGRWRRTETVG